MSIARVIRWPRSDNLTFYGRNGTGLCTGLQVVPLFRFGRVCIEPITSKGVPASCNIDLPLDPEKLIEVAGALLQAAATKLGEPVSLTKNPNQELSS